jgi:hypothetical protein
MAVVTHWLFSAENPVRAPVKLTIAARVATPGWFQLANDPFYLIVSDMFQCMCYDYITEVRRDFFFSKMLAVLTRLTRTLC